MLSFGVRPAGRGICLALGEARDAIQEHFDRSFPGLEHREPDGGQRWIEQGAKVLIVDPDDIDAEYSVIKTSENHEFWGQICEEPLEILFEQSCTWHGRRIINAEEVCWELEEILH